MVAYAATLAKLDLAALCLGLPADEIRATVSEEVLEVLYSKKARRRAVFRLTEQSVGVVHASADPALAQRGLLLL